jgi:hypothetical protein
MPKIAPAINDLFGGTAAYSQLQAAASDEIRSPSVLGHVMRIFIPHVDYGGSDFNSSRPGADRSKQWERGCQLLREVMNAEVGPVHSQALSFHGEIN